jgi:membrane protein YdbS with pleckstrin-like domain
MENKSKDNLVEEWNSELAKALIPNDVLLSLYIILGIFGNVTVILVYGLRMKKKTENRYFIPVLAVSDLTGVIVCSSFALALNMMQAQFYNTHLCKAWWFFAALTTSMSIFLLLIIAAQRYITVCRPVGSQMTLMHKRLAIGLSIGLAIIVAGPTSALYGSVEFPNSDGGIVGVRCSKLKDVSKAGSLVYGVVVVLVILTSITLMIYFYSRIGHKLFIHFKYRTTVDSDKRRPSCTEQGSSNSESGYDKEMCTSTSQVDMNTVDQHESNTDDEVDINTVDQRESSTNEEKTPTSVETKQKTSRQHKSKKDHEQINRRVMHKLTIMFMLITFVFLICYIPKVVLLLIEGLDPNFWENFSDSERSAVLFIYRIFILNNVVNPFIYAFMDLEFRKEVKSMIRC